jgi:hypothetical protein
LALIDGDFDPEEQRQLSEQLNLNDDVSSKTLIGTIGELLILMTSDACSSRTPTVRSNS